MGTAWCKTYIHWIGFNDLTCKKSDQGWTISSCQFFNICNKKDQRLFTHMSISSIWVLCFIFWASAIICSTSSLVTFHVIKNCIILSCHQKLVTNLVCAFSPKLFMTCFSSLAVTRPPGELQSAPCFLPSLRWFVRIPGLLSRSKTEKASCNSSRFKKAPWKICTCSIEGKGPSSSRVQRGCDFLHHSITNDHSVSPSSTESMSWSFAAMSFKNLNMAPLSVSTDSNSDTLILANASHIGHLRNELREFNLSAAILSNEAAILVRCAHVCWSSFIHELSLSLSITWYFGL